MCFFVDFVRFVKILEPKFFVMENVKGLLSMRTKKNLLVKDIILQEFQKINYNVSLQILSSANYGVPQIRERVFFIGIRNDIAFDKNYDMIFEKTSDNAPEYFIKIYGRFLLPCILFNKCGQSMFLSARIQNLSPTITHKMPKYSKLTASI